MKFIIISLCLVLSGCEQFISQRWNKEEIQNICRHEIYDVLKKSKESLENTYNECVRIKKCLNKPIEIIFDDTGSARCVLTSNKKAVWCE